MQQSCDTYSSPTKSPATPADLPGSFNIIISSESLGSRSKNKFMYSLLDVCGAQHVFKYVSIVAVLSTFFRHPKQGD